MFLFYLIAALAALVWGLVILRRGGLLLSCVLLVPLACCFGADFYKVSVGPLPMTLDRAVLGGLAVVYVVYRGLGKLQPPRLSKTDIVFALFLLALAGNTLMHNWRLNGAQPLANLLFLFLAPAAVYWIVRDSGLEERHLRWIYGFLALFSVYLAVTGLAEVKQLNGMIFPRYIVHSSYYEWIGRARGPFLNPVTNGIYMSAGIFAWAMIWLRSGRIGKLLIAPLMCLILAGVYCTLTRSCWIGCALGLALIGFAVIPQYWRLPMLVGCLILTASVLILKSDDITSFKRDKNVSEYHMAQSAQLRPMLAIVAWKIAVDYPLFGCGYGQYKQVDVNYLHDPHVDLPLERVKPFVQHNVLLSLLAETGLTGVSLYVALWTGWIYGAWRLWSNTRLPVAMRQFGLLFVALFLCWLVNGMFHDVNLNVNANLLMFLVAGLSQGVVARQGAPRPSRGEARSRVMRAEVMGTSSSTQWSNRPGAVS